jgi:hypothetical protein
VLARCAAVGLLAHGRILRQPRLAEAVVVAVHGVGRSARVLGEVIAEEAQPIDAVLAVLIRRDSRSSDPVAADDVPGGQHKRRWVWGTLARAKPVELVG